MTDDPIASYLANLRRSMRGRPDRDRVMGEVEDHLRESAATLEQEGMSAPAARREAVRRMGDAEELSRAFGGRVGAIAVLVVGWAGAILLLGAGAAVHGPGGDAHAAGAPVLLAVGGLAAAVLTPLAALVVWSWSSATATADARWRRVTALVAAIAAAVLAEVAVHVAKHQSGGDLATRERRALACLAMAALILCATLVYLELHARSERRRR